ncbi:hypothetical protein Dda3937_02764 [Dickeya dadantii 3937]|uniref:Uncharacterized protein n=1 Tax=Dickeya dadantii (strain 3937) TaxID=198628 RepID=E0SJG7_DICD3|nr:hypothetical protein Dda3937_02764 [Dickeya dadantii 3937]
MPFNVVFKRLSYTLHSVARCHQAACFCRVTPHTTLSSECRLHVGDGESAMGARRPPGNLTACTAFILLQCSPVLSQEVYISPGFWQ